MRTAESIYDSVFQNNERLTKRDAAIEAINEARKEAIQTCADLLNTENSERMIEKILSLINELK